MDNDNVYKFMSDFDYKFIMDRIYNSTIGSELVSTKPMGDDPSVFKHVKQEDLPDSKICVNDEPEPLTMDEVDKMVRWQINNGSKQTYDELFAWFKPIVKYLMNDGSYEVRFKGWFGGIYNVNKDFTEIKLIGRQ